MENFEFRKIIAPHFLPQQNKTIVEWSEQLSRVLNAQIVLFNAAQPHATDGEALQNSPGSKITLFLKSSMIRLQKLGKILNVRQNNRFIDEAATNWRDLIKLINQEHADLLVAEMPPLDTLTPAHLTSLMFNSPCPVFFVRCGMKPVLPVKILVPVRLKDNIEQTIPVLAALAKECGATLYLSAFSHNDASQLENNRLYFMLEEMKESLCQENVKAMTETVQGYHFGMTMVNRAMFSNADLIAISVEHGSFVSRIFANMIGPYFLENSSVPVLSIPSSSNINASQKILSDNGRSVMTYLPFALR
jgi:hypothetical protein